MQPIDLDDDPLGRLEFEFLIDHAGQGLHYVYSHGLAGRGLPEVYVGPGPRGGPPEEELLEDLPHHLVQRARWLTEVTRDLVTGSLVQGLVRLSPDLSWRYWPGPPERTAGILRVALPGVPEVIPVIWGPA